MGARAVFFLATCVLATTASGSPPAVAVRVGEITHGQTIPLPTYQNGTTADPADCVWAIFPRTIHTGHNRVYGFTCDATANRVANLSQVTLDGTFFDPTATYFIMAVRGGGSAEVALLSGTAGHGDLLPLPTYHDGTAPDLADCHWLATPRQLPTGYNSLLGFECWVGPDRVVTMRQYSYAGITYVGTVNYLVVAVREDPGWQAAVRAESRAHGNAIVFPTLPLGGDAHASGTLSGVLSLSPGHDATLGFAVLVDPGARQYLRQSTIAGGGSEYFDSLAMTLTIVTGPAPPVGLRSDSWGRSKAVHR